MNLTRNFTAIVLVLSLSACFQTQLAGPTGHSLLEISELHSGAVVVPATETLGVDTWAGLKPDDWDGYPPFLQLLVQGIANPNTDALEPGTLYLVTASGGVDYDPGADTTQLDPNPVVIQGSWHAIASGARIQAGDLKVSALTEAIYQQVIAHLDIYSDEEIAAQLDAAALLLVADVDKSGAVDYNDALLWSSTLDRSRYIGDLEQLDLLATAVINGQPADMLADQAKLVYGSNLVSLNISYGEVSGVVTMETLNWDAPIGAANFLQYVRDEFYTDVFFHRVIEDFMIQGGIWGRRDGTVLQLTAEQRPTIFNEARSGVSNLRGTVAYARTGDPHSATSQFFINHVDNSSGDRVDLDYNSPNNPDGYTVFARVTSGMDLVDDIVTLPVQSVSGVSEAVPSPDVVITTAVITN
jgi:cyclophilin family peptidyl-prolyl cis-trans isomerase